MGCWASPARGVLSALAFSMPYRPRGLQRRLPDGGFSLSAISGTPSPLWRCSGVLGAGRSVPICSAVSGWEATAMPVTEREIYRSPNGDQWYLVQERGSDRGYVRHQPNRASGGQSSLTDVREFLAEGHGPQSLSGSALRRRHPCRWSRRCSARPSRHRLRGKSQG